MKRKFSRDSESNDEIQDKKDAGDDTWMSLLMEVTKRVWTKSRHSGKFRLTAKWRSAPSVMPHEQGTAIARPTEPHTCAAAAHCATGSSPADVGNA